jgi:hypothetical protein
LFIRRQFYTQGVHMKGKLVLIVGVAGAYVLGARAGRERYEQIMSHARRVLADPTVQQAVSQAGDLVKKRAQDAQST